MGGGTDKIVLSAGDDIIDFSGIALTGVELIDAGAGNDVITASAANDVLKGGSGNDTFIFETGFFGTGFGHDMVLDFAIGTGTAHDVIDLSDAGFADFNALVAATSEVNGATVISVGTSQSVSLANVSLAQLTQDHFIL